MQKNEINANEALLRSVNKHIPHMNELTEVFHRIAFEASIGNQYLMHTGILSNFSKRYLEDLGYLVYEFKYSDEFGEFWIGYKIMFGFKNDNSDEI